MLPQGISQPLSCYVQKTKPSKRLELPQNDQHDTRGVQGFFLFSRILFPPGPEPLTQLTPSSPGPTSTTSATQPSALTRQEACPDAGKRQVGSWRNVQRNTKGAEYQQVTQGQTQEGPEKAATARSVMPFPTNMTRPAKISPNSTRCKPTQTHQAKGPHQSTYEPTRAPNINAWNSRH